MSTALDVKPADLAKLTDDDLAALFTRACADADAELQRVILAIVTRRDQAAAYWREVNARNNALREEWRQAAYAQYLAAEAVTNGYLVRAGSPLTDAFRLWSGSERFAMAHASEELANFWLENPRVTVTAYLAQHANAQQVYRDDMDRAGMDAGAATDGGTADDGMGPDEPASFRPVASAGEESPRGCADRGEQLVSRPAPGTEAGAGAGRVPAGNAGHVRGPVVTRDTDDGARVEISRGGVGAGHAYRAQVTDKANGFKRWAWWGVRPDGSMFLRADKRAAVAAVLA
jgi:hypothetical protein